MLGSLLIFENIGENQPHKWFCSSGTAMISLGVYIVVDIEQHPEVSTTRDGSRDSIWHELYGSREVCRCRWQIFPCWSLDFVSPTNIFLPKKKIRFGKSWKGEFSVLIQLSSCEVGEGLSISWSVYIWSLGHDERPSLSSRKCFNRDRGGISPDSTSNWHEEAERSSGSQHILTQCSHYTICTCAISEDVDSSENEADNDTHSATHHCSHL